MRAPALIGNANSLNEAITWRWLLKLESSVELRLPKLDEARTKQLQLAVDQQAKACGCTEGGAGAVLFLTAYLLSLWFNIWRSDLSTLSLMATGFGFVLLGSLAGKCLGLLRARSALRRTLLEAREELRAVS
jgi:hypothetical protein